MIDTINLLIPMDKLRFSVGAWDLNSKTAQYQKFVRNPSKNDLEKWSYLPRLTGYKRNGLGKEKNIRIEFSIPKLLFLNNLDEVQQSDFPSVINMLQERLNAMGVIADKEVLENASVSSVHFSKNIQLRDGFTVSYVISEINKVNITKCFDLAQTRYINGGESLYAHTTSHQLVIYDKIADLKKEDKRAIDKEQPKYQRSLFEDLKEGSVEIIRFEIRLGSKQKMNKLFEQLGYQKNLIFKDIFNSDLSQKVMIYYWNRLIKERSLGLFALPFSMKDALRILFVGNKKIRPKQAIYLIGLTTLAKDDGGFRMLRSILSKKSNCRTWYRFMRDVQTANKIITNNKIRNWVIQIDEALAEFEPYKYKKLST
ncbi:MAG: hypothetical protein AB1333_03015 [Patescibacteria group bacterium]